MANVRRLRILEYVGPEDWVTATVENENRYVKGLRVLSVEPPAPVAFGDPMPEAQPPRRPTRYIREYLSEAEEVPYGS